MSAGLAIKSALAAAKGVRGAQAAAKAARATRLASAAARSPAAVRAARFAGMGPLQQILSVAKPASLAQFGRDSIPDALFAGITGASMLAQGASPVEAIIGAGSDFASNATLGNVGGKAAGAAAGRFMGGSNNPQQLRERMENFGNMGMFAGNMVVPYAVPNPGFNMMNDRMTQELQKQQQLIDNSVRRPAQMVDAGGNLDYERLLYGLSDDALQAIY